MQYAYFGVTIVSQVFVVARVKFRLDPSMFIVLAVDLLSFLFRLPVISGAGMNFVSGFGMQVVYVLLYYFVFQMVHLRIKLESSTLQEHLLARRVHLYRQIVVYSLYTVFVLGQFSLHYSLTAFSPETLTTHTALFDSLWILRATVKFVVDLYMMNAFLSTFGFLVKLKAEQ